MLLRPLYKLEYSVVLLLIKAVVTFQIEVHWLLHLEVLSVPGLKRGYQ